MVSNASYAYEVDGVVLPVPVSGEVTLELCNTAAGWGEPEPKKDYLRGYDELVVWARESGLVEREAAEWLRAEAASKPDAAADMLARALGLREGVYATALGGDGWEVVALEAQRAAATARLTPDGWMLPRRLDLPVLATARRAADFLLSPRRSAVRACPGRQCGWLFLDPAGRRRWCSMSTCGNREKQRRHAQRARGGAASAGG